MLLSRIETLPKDDIPLAQDRRQVDPGLPAPPPF